MKEQRHHWKFTLSKVNWPSFEPEFDYIKIGLVKSGLSTNNMEDESSHLKKWQFS